MYSVLLLYNISILFKIAVLPLWIQRKNVFIMMPFNHYMCKYLLQTQWQVLSWVKQSIIRKPKLQWDYANICIIKRGSFSRGKIPLLVTAWFTSLTQLLSVILPSFLPRFKGNIATWSNAGDFTSSVSPLCPVITTHLSLQCLLPGSVPFEWPFCLHEHEQTHNIPQTHTHHPLTHCLSKICM